LPFDLSAKETQMIVSLKIAGSVEQATDGIYVMIEGLLKDFKMKRFNPYKYEESTMVFV
jgi:thymidine kinase